MINIYHQKVIKPGPDLRKMILEMLDEEGGQKIAPSEEPEAEDEDDVFVASKLEDVIKFFVGTINLAFGGGEYTSNEIHEFLQTTEDSVSKYETLDGGMYLFRYNPQSSLRYMKQYDALPLAIMIGQTSDGFDGLNLHYLPDKYRVSFMRSMFGDEDLNKVKEDEVVSKLARTVNYKFVKPCYKRYKYTGISSRLVRIPPQNWLMASLLPISNFQLKSRKEVWADSVRMINDERRRL